MYFYPFAFIFGQKQKFYNHIDFLNLINNSNGEILLKKEDWLETDGQLLGPTWPAIADDTHVFIITPAAKNSAYKIK